MFSAGDFELTASGLNVIFQVEVMSLGLLDTFKERPVVVNAASK